MIKKQLAIIICLILFSSLSFAAQTDWSNGDSGLVTRTAIQANDTELYGHMQSALNPHSVTATQLSLGNVDNTADADKPVSTDQLAALALKEDDLGNPGTNGYILSSLTDGTRSWIAPGSGSGDLLADGTVPLTANWVLGAFDIGSTGTRINKGWFTDIETTNGIVVTQGVTAQYIEIYEASGDGTNKHRITAQAFGSDWNSLWPDYQIGFLAFASVNSSGLAVAAGIADWYAYDPIPIAWMNGGTSEPDALDITTRTPYAYRTFDPTADEDLNFVWFVPSDLSGTTIQFRVKYLVTNATGPSAEGVAFGLSGVSLGDNDLTNAAKGTVVVITDPTITAVQHDILITGWSGDVTITNLLAGEVAEVALIRDVSDAADTYAQVVGVFAIEIRYVRNVAR